MPVELAAFHSTLISGVLGIMDKLFTGIPWAKDAIMWMLFVILVMNLIVLPIRGYGASDRALAKDVRSGRALSTSSIKAGRADAAARHQKKLERHSRTWRYKQGYDW